MKLGHSSLLIEVHLSGRFPTNHSPVFSSVLGGNNRVLHVLADLDADGVCVSAQVEVVLHES